MSETPPSRDYHHGDLRRALVAAGLEILERDGVEGLSLRAVARQVQVSHNAPYHHFADKAELLAAVAAAGFDALSESIAHQVAAAQAGNLLDGLRGVGRGYLQFAAARPAVFRLMFRPELTRPAEHPLLKEAEARAFGLLVSQVAGCQQSGELPGADPLPPAAMCWSMVHGLAVLRVEQVLDETPLGDLPFEQLAAMAVEAAIRGVRGSMH